MIPVFFDEFSFATYDEHRCRPWYCVRCGLGVLKGGGALPSCVRCGARDWSAYKQDAGKRRLVDAQVQINDALLTDGNPKARGLALLAQSLLDELRASRGAGERGPE